MNVGFAVAVLVGLSIVCAPAVARGAQASEDTTHTGDARDATPETEPRGEGGSLALGSRLMLRGGATFGSGTRPLWVSSESAYSIRQYGLEVRGSTPLLSERSVKSFFRNNPLGTGFALEFQVAALYSHESPVMRDRSPVPFEVVGNVGLAGRVLSLGKPAWLALVFHANPEVSWGGQYWWSDTMRLTVFGGPRLLLRFGSFASEVDYSFVPDYLTGSPAGMDVDRWEHRISGGVSVGPFGLGARHVIASERTRTPAPDDLRSHASATFVFLELRRPR